jgi:hypothetical protein
VRKIRFHQSKQLWEGVAADELFPSVQEQWEMFCKFIFLSGHRPVTDQDTSFEHKKPDIAGVTADQPFIRVHIVGGDDE